MNPRRFSPAVLTAILLFAGGCAKRVPEPPPPQKPVTGVVQPSPKAATAPAAKSPAPKPAPKPKPAPVPEREPEPVPHILFSLRGLDSGQLANDRPLFVGVRVESSVDKESALTLAPATGRWSDALKVELAAMGAPEKVLLRAQRVDGAGEAPAATLGTAQAAEGTWLFPSAGIAQLAPGDYQVQAKLGIPDGTGWHGGVAGEPAAFKLVVAAGATTPAQLTERAVALAGEAMLVQDWPKAAQLLDERLANDPDNIDLLKTRALLCLEGDNPLAANVCVSRAWARVMRENWPHPPSDLYLVSQAVAAALQKGPSAHTDGALPPWTLPPQSVLVPLPMAQPPPKGQ